MANSNQQEWGPMISDRSFFTLYLGNRNGQDFSKIDREKAFEIVCSRFPSFTVLSGEGYYKGKSLPTLIFQIATKDRYALEQLCDELCLQFDQKWIGVAEIGTYRSVARRHQAE